MKKFSMVVVALFVAINGYGYWGDRTAPEVIGYISTIIDLSDKVVCDIGSAEGNVMIEFAEYAKSVKGMEQNTGLAPLTMLRKDRDGKRLNVIQGDATKDVLPEADVYYIWVGRNVLSEIIQRIIVDDIKKIFIIGHCEDYVYQEYFKFMKMQKHTVSTWRGDFDIYIWDRK